MHIKNLRAPRLMSSSRSGTLSLALAFSLSLGLHAGCQKGGESPADLLPPADAAAQIDELPPDVMTELDRYVKTPDPSYAFSLLSTVPGTGYTAYILSMTSQTWRSTTEVDRTLWQHTITIVKPDGAAPGPGILIISGGSNSSAPPTKPSDQLVTIAKGTGSVVVELKQVPNQPLTFTNHDGKPHTEDGIIAFSWAKVMTTGDATWSARFPMVKSAVYAMDTAQKFLGSAAGGSYTLDKFVVVGASKRGWTTWLTAAVDPRVVVAVPLVIDVLNVEKFMKQHVESYGFWANSLYDYHYNRITDHLGTSEMTFMLKNEDPYLFRKRLTMPKYMVNASGDQFFLPDGSQNYFDDLTGEKYLRYVPNADHSLDGTDALEGVLAYFLNFRDGRERPSFTWKFEGTDTIRIESKDKPQKVLLWQATNAKARDFRVEQIGKVWTSTELAEQGTAGSGVYVGKVTAPPQGYTAYFIEMAYPSGQIYPLKFTSQVRVIPDVRPFAGIDPKTAKLEAEP